MERQGPCLSKSSLKGRRAVAEVNNCPPPSPPPLLSHCGRTPEFAAGHVAAQSKDRLSQPPLHLGIAMGQQRGRWTCRLHVVLTLPPFWATGKRRWGWRARLDRVDGDTLPGWRNKTKEAQHPDDFAEQSHPTCLGSLRREKCTSILFKLLLRLVSQLELELPKPIPCLI